MNTGNCELVNPPKIIMLPSRKKYAFIKMYCFWFPNVQLSTKWDGLLVSFYNLKVKYHSDRASETLQFIYLKC